MAIIKIYSSFVLILMAILIFGKCKRLCDHDEYQCKNNNNDCVEINRHCNGLKDCNNNSDKINNCSSCNLTYFGQVGRTYGLEIRKPPESQLPFLCYLNFTTFGGNYGDLIQISFETFSIGKFESFTIDGCPNGFIQIQENNRPSTNGKWCGSSWGYTVYYSETSTILLILNLLKYDGNFEFKINYKFLKLSEAYLRYGRNNNNLTTITTNKRIYRGKLQIHSYCDRLYENCIRKQCRIQSPNYPGIYQRNLTCNYRIREKNVPNDKHALIAIRQANFHYKERLSKFDNSDKILRIWDQCNMMQDYIEIYDGWNEKSTLLTHLCSGETIPEIISSGPELLIKFHTSPYGNPFHPLPLSYLPGFELEVEVFYVDKESPTYIENDKKCEFLITPTYNGNNHNKSGIIESPLNSLPPNTTCHYYFHGHTNKEIIWLSFIKYYINNSPNTNNERISEINTDECDVKLQIWDGNLRNYQKTIPLIGQFCKDDQPKLCDHTLLTNSTRKTRPCSLTESYLSTQQDLTIVHSIRYGSVLSPVNFVLKYEFIDLSQEGEQFNHKNPCDRIFVINNEAENHTEMKTGRFYSPKITFLFGRGGQESLTCSYRFEATQSGNHRLKLVFFNGKFGNKKCQTRYNHETDRYICEQQQIDDGYADLKIYEYPWLNNIEIIRDCLCENFTETKQILINTSNRVVVKFTMTNMKIYEDFNDYNFDGFYEFLPQIEDNSCGDFKKNRHLLHGSSGEISIYSNHISNHTNYCLHRPWLIEPQDPLNNYLYLKIKGMKVRDSRLCPGRNRILIYSVGSTEDVQIICPYYKNIDDFVELFSDGWTITTVQQSKNKKFPQNQQSKSFIIEFIQKETGDFVVNWMEISKNPAVTLSSTMLMLNPPECPYSCPELGACISSDLWCDGLIHCPSGNDEQESNCLIYQNQFPISYLNTTTLIIIIILLILIISIIVVMIFCYWKRDQQKNVVVSVTEHTFLEFKSGLC